MKKFWNSVASVLLTATTTFATTFSFTNQWPGGGQGFFRFQHNGGFRPRPGPHPNQRARALFRGNGAGMAQRIAALTERDDRRENTRQCGQILGQSGAIPRQPVLSAIYAAHGRLHSLGGGIEHHGRGKGADRPGV